MKKIVLNIPDSIYEKFRLEAIEGKKSIQDVIHDRIYAQPFSKDVENSFESWMQQQINDLK